MTVEGAWEERKFTPRFNYFAHDTTLYAHTNVHALIYLISASHKVGEAMFIVLSHIILLTTYIVLVHEDLKV